MIGYRRKYFLAVLLFTGFVMMFLVCAHSRTYRWDFHTFSDASALDGLVFAEQDERPEVYFKNELLPYDAASNTLYLPQSYEKDEWGGTYIHI